MFGSSEVGILSPTSYTSLNDLFDPKLEYRLHEIHFKFQQGRVAAVVYDGRKVVHVAHGSTEADAVERARRWIDEQDEENPAHDLHT
jgi:hypothetical protein